MKKRLLRFTNVLLLPVLFLLLMAVSNKGKAQSLISDFDDYPPGSVAKLTGSGFTLGEAIYIHVDHFIDGIGHEDEDYKLEASENTKDPFYFYYNIGLDEAYDAFIVTARQDNGKIASSSFTDAPLTDTNLGLTASITNFVQGSSVTLTATLTAGGSTGISGKTIQFSIDKGSITSSATTNALGIATFTTNISLTPGNYPGENGFSANFNGDATYKKSQSSTIGFVVTAPCSAPTITCPNNIIQNVDASNCDASVSFAASATGTPAPSITYKIGATTITSPYIFPKGTSTVDVSASNGCGTATCSFTVTVVDNIHPAIVGLPQNIEVNNDHDVCGAVVSWTAPTSADNCTGSSIAQTAGLASGSEFPIGTTIIEFTATDASGNTTSASFTVTVTDAQHPTIVSLPSNISVDNDADVCGAVVSWTAPTSADNVGSYTQGRTAGDFLSGRTRKSSGEPPTEYQQPPDLPGS